MTTRQAHKNTGPVVSVHFTTHHQVAHAVRNCELSNTAAAHGDANRFPVHSRASM